MQLMFVCKIHKVVGKRICIATQVVKLHFDDGLFDDAVIVKCRVGLVEMHLFEGTMTAVGFLAINAHATPWTCFAVVEGQQFGAIGTKSGIIKHIAPTVKAFEVCWGKQVFQHLAQCLQKFHCLCIYCKFLGIRVQFCTRPTFAKLSIYDKIVVRWCLLFATKVT